MALGYDWVNVAGWSVAKGNATVNFWIDLKLNRQDTSNNYSVIDSRLTSTIVNNLAGSGYNFQLTGSGGTSGSSTWYFGNETILTGQFTVNHNNDGTGYASASAYVYNKYWSISNTFGGGVDLPTIPRASQPSCVTYPTTTEKVGKFGDEITIHMNRKANFNHTVTYTFGTKTGTIGTNVSDNVKWIIPKDLASEIPNSQEGSGTITAATYNGSTLIGSKSVTFKVSISDDMIPTLDESDIYDGSEEISSKNWGVYVKDKSYIQITASGTGSYSSTILKYNCIINDQTYESDTVGNLNNLLKNIGLIVGEQTAVIKVIDSRGIESESNSHNYIVEDYINPSITTASAQRCTELGVSNDDGTYVKMALSGQISSISGNNKLTVKVYYKKKTDTDYDPINTITYMDGVAGQDSFDFTGANVKIFGGNFSTDNTYDILMEVSDEFGSNFRTAELSTGFDIIHFHRSGKSLAIGKKSEATDEEKHLEIALETDIKAPLNVESLSINGVEFKDDTVPIGSVFNYDGEVVPEGYEEVIDDYYPYKIKEVWVNSNPKANFGPQTISVPNLNKAEYIMVEFVSWKSDLTNCNTGVISCVEDQRINLSCLFMANSNNLYGGSRRGRIHKSANTIEWSTCYGYDFQTSGARSTSATFPDWNIPYKIYLLNKFE